MPSRAAVDAFVARVLSEDHAGAIADLYAEDASMQENQEPPRVGRAALVAGEQQMLARFAGVRSELLAPPLVNGDQVAIRWRFEFTGADDKVRAMEEVAWQRWDGDRVAEEQFFYDPAQMAG